MCYIPALYKEYIHSYNDFWLLPVSEHMWTSGEAGGARYCTEAVDTWRLCTVTGHTVLSTQAEGALTCSWLSLDAAAHKPNGFPKLSVMTSGFFFFSHMLQPSVPKWPLLNHLWIYYLSTVMEKEATAYVTLTNHSSQIRIMPMDAEVLFSLPWLSRQLYVWLKLQACYDLKGASLSTKISSYH